MKRPRFSVRTRGPQRRALPRTAVLAFLCALGVLRGEARAQRPDGYVSLAVDGLPNVERAPVELRARLFADEKLTPFQHLTLRASGSLDVLGVRTGIEQGGGEAQDLQVVPSELHAELTGSRGDLRVGYSRVVWGRLDEVQPTDVVNPLDLARFFFEGRADARLAVPMLRARLFFGERANVEAIVVPHFQRGRFDLLDEPTSPFNLEKETLPVRRDEPATTWRNLQGGGRVSVTTGRVDWAVSAFRGFDAFGNYVPIGVTQAAAPATPTALVQVFPRYTMVGGDFETTKGMWALRGELARFSGGLDGLDAGAGFDRRAGGYHLTGTFLVHHEGARSCVHLDAICASAGPAGAYTSASFVAAADRSFSRERYRTRTFAVYNATEGTGFLRNITSMEVRADVTLEGSIGWFLGAGGSPARRDVMGRFSDRDFLYARLRVHF